MQVLKSKEAIPNQLASQPVAEKGKNPAMKSALRGTDFAGGEAMLKPPAAVQQKSGPGKEAAATAKDSAPQLPDNVDLQAVRMGFQIPGNKTFAENWKYAARTTGPTNVGLEVTPTGLSVWTSPGLYFDVQWPAQNMNMYGAGVDFKTGKPHADFRVVRGMGEGFLDYTETGAKTVTDLLAQAIAGTAMAQPGYNPMTDHNITQTLSKIKANFDKMPAVGGGDKVAPKEVSKPSIGATLAMKTPFLKTGGGAGVSIPGGGSFDVNIQGSGNLASILAAGSAPQAAAMAAGIDSVSVRSSSMTLVRENGKPLAKLNDVTIKRGGIVTLGSFELLGGLGAGAGIESLIRLVGILASTQGQGIGGAMAADNAIRNGAADAQIVKGVSRSMIESGLSDAVRSLLTENRGAVPGMDLALVFGL